MSVLKDKYRMDFIPQELYDKLDKETLNKLLDYREQFRLLAIKEKKIKRDEEKLKVQKQLLRDMIRNLKDMDPFLQHLRSEYNINNSVTSYKGKNGTRYFNICVGRKGRTTKNCSLGNEETTLAHLKKYYRKDKKVLNEINEDWVGWMKYEINFGSTYTKLLSMVMDNPNGFKNMTINRDLLFPLKHSTSFIHSKKKKWVSKTRLPNLYYF